MPENIPYETYVTFQGRTDGTTEVSFTMPVCMESDIVEVLKERHEIAMIRSERIELSNGTVYIVTVMPTAEANNLKATMIKAMLVSEALDRPERFN